ncbi:MAG: hypothetical protein ACTSVY_00070 [Candidatus Helarchaeota archaeon]
MENEIIKLLTEIVGSIKRNNEILTQNNQLLIELQNQLNNLPSGGGGGDFEKMGTDLKKAINDVQKGFQVIEINRALNEVRELMSFISEAPVQTAKTLKAGTSEPIPLSPGSPVTRSPQAEPEEEEKDDGHLLKPSDLFS